MSANRFSALGVFWKRKEREYGMHDERQKRVCPGLSPRDMVSKGVSNVRCVSGLSGNVSSCNFSTLC